MAGGVPFDQASFIAGIHTAMSVGLPEDTGLQPVFVFRDTVTTTVPVDADNVPYDPAATPTVTPGARVRVPCAVEYLDTRGQLVDFGVVFPSQIRLTLLDDDYRQIKGFAWVVIGADRYTYRRTAPPQGMVTATIWTVYCQAEDEG